MNLINNIMRQINLNINMVGDSFDNKDVQNIIEREGKDGEILKCKIRGVRFDNHDAFEGHIAAGYLIPSA